MREIELAGKYIGFAKIIGASAAAELYREDIIRAKKKDRIRRLKEKLLELPAADVGTAYQNILAEQVGIFSAERPTETVWSAERIIFQIQTLEMEI